ncbi:MAG: right-handed parallel beta-helix repeat-containing protein [Thermoplasmatales archaeon]|nr:MAG: right-handed parallel beta-helix repeat-containing protein [Thermoplasmatales archaeon]
MNKLLAFGIMLLFIGMTISSSTGINVVKQSTIVSLNGNTLYVGGNGTGNYSRIQDAIDNASDGDTVFVYDDSSPYIEYLHVDKSISLIGENRDTTDIEGGVYINKNWINVSGFKISKAYQTIVINSAHNNISNNILEAHPAHGYGILCYSGYNIISNNYIYDSTNGTSIYGGGNNVITHNQYVYNDNIGIDVHGDGNNTICFNTFVNNNFGIMLTSPNNDVFNCTIKSCGYDGIQIYVYLNNPINNTIKNCNIISCNRYGIYLFPSSSNNMIYHNNLINNTQNARDTGSNTWDDDYPSGGNYWSDYTDEDNNGDGIGDTPYPIPGGGNEDRYPLMEPWGIENQPPDAPIITGPINGKVRVSYDYNFSLFDPDGDSMDLRVDWGVGGPGKLYGPFDSGTIVTLNYSWCKKGNYSIRAQAIDSMGAESEWGILEVTMPYIYHSNRWMGWLDRFPLLQRLLGRFIW